MIAKESIELVQEVPLEEVIKKHVPTLKHKGANWTGLCPFHDEKSGSLSVSPSKNVYKCFGCGAGGIGGVNFIMNLKKLSWIEAIRDVAKDHNITVVETEDAPGVKEQRIKRDGYAQINLAAAEKYRLFLQFLRNSKSDEKHPVVDELLNKRKLTDETLSLFGIGFAPDEWKFLTPHFIEHNLYEPAVELGLIKTKADTTNTYDTFRNRIMFPIHNERGEIIGFGGRKMQDDNAENPKYKNSSDSFLYKKDNVLYGIYQAAAAIRKMGFACIVEGYFDVASFFQTGAPNTVAPCGTALCEGHLKILKRYTNHLVLIGDGDSAGMSANLKAVDLCVKEGFKVEILPLPKGQDPDTFAREFKYVEEEV